MTIEQFIAQSEGEWNSMRSGHSLAFRQFEQVTSLVTIKIIEKDNPEVCCLLKTIDQLGGNLTTPFQISWEADTDWAEYNSSTNTKGSCILVPLSVTSKKGHILRSKGYTEPTQAISEYNFLEDGTFVMRTNYMHSISEEKIWFLSENVRCRSSVIKTSNGSGILQTSFASEVRKIRPSK